MEATCNGCGETFDAARSDARYCSSRCRTAAHRKRTQPEPSSPRPRRPLPAAWLSAGIELRKAVERVGRLSRDDRMSKNLEVVRDQSLSDLVRARDQIDAAIAELLQVDSAVTDIQQVSADSPRPFKKTDTESLDEITGAVENMASFAYMAVRPGHVEHDDALRMATRARLAWQRLDRRLTEIVTPRRSSRSQ